MGFSLDRRKIMGKNSIVLVGKIAKFDRFVKGQTESLKFETNLKFEILIESATKNPEKTS